MTEPSQWNSAEPAIGAPDEFEFRLMDYWRILVRRRLVVVASLVTIVMVTMTLTLLTAPKYRATTTLEIQRYSPEVVEFADVVNVDPSAYWDFHQTQQKILQSRTVARIAAERLDLMNRPELAARRISPIARFIGWTKTMFATDDEPEEPGIEGATGYVQGGVSVALVRNSYLVEVSFTDRDPVLAADIANAVADAYQQFQLDSRYNTTGQAKEFLTKDVARVQADVTRLENQLQAYGVEKEILALSDGTQDITEQALADINQRYTEARTKLPAARARSESVQHSPPEALKEVLSSPLIAQLRQKHAELEREHSQMAERFKEDWPPLLKAADELRQVRLQLTSEAENVALHVRATAKADYEEAQVELAALERARDEQKLEVQRVNRDAIDYSSLKTEIETKRRVLANLVERQSETETSYRLKDTGASNVRLVDQAAVPEFPISPKKKLNLALSLMFGLCAGIGLALVIDHLDNSIKSEQDIEQAGALPVLGHTPLTRSLGAVGTDDPRSKAQYLDLVSHVDPRSHFAESLRNLRTSILLASPERPPKHVLVTSCEPGDGKSTVALNLAIVLTQLGRKILLVDADLRRPRLHSTFDLSNDVGLSSYLSGNASLDEIAHETEVPNLWAIPSGPIPPNPSELLGSPHIDALLDEYLESNGFDHLIMDSPPLLSVADSVVLSARTESTMVVVRAGATRRESLTQGAAKLRQSRARVIGAVLNARNDDGWYYSQYRYRRYYGEAEREQSKADRKASGQRERSRQAG